MAAQNQPRLDGVTVAILATEGFEQVELTEPKKALEQAGATVHVVAPKSGSIRGWNHTEWGENVPVDRTLDDAADGDYDALVLPGGVMNPDRLRTDEQAVRFVEAFFRDDKPVSVICHGPWTLIEADVVRGRRMTSYHSLKTDLRNAGAEWVNEPVVTDGNLTTSRNPGDIEQFNARTIERIAAASAVKQTA